MGTRLAWPASAAWAMPRRLPRSLYVAVARAGRAAPIAVLFALAARLPYFVHTDFPLNDGGLFVAMSQDLFAHHFALPEFTTYNAAAIPFAYPPLGFYVLAGLHALDGLDMIELDRWLPLLANLATVLVVLALARATLQRRMALAVGLAPIIFALQPRSYQWMIMGGGITRALGLLLATGCVLQAVQLARRPSIPRILVCALLAALALASHLEEGLFALYSMTLALLCYGRNLRSVLVCVAVGVGAVVFAAPWWAVVVARHGLAPFEAASLTSDWSGFEAITTALGTFLAPSSVPLGVLGGLGVVGALACVLRGELFLVLWLPAIFVITPRSATSEAVLPLALLAAAALGDLILPGLAALIRESQGLSAARRWLYGDVPGWARATAAVVALGVVLGGVFATWPRLPLEPYSLDSLPASERQAMAWIATNTPSDARVLVLSTTGSWEEDMSGEWFPELAQRQSVLTPQGSEWLPDQAFARKTCLFNKIRTLASYDYTIADLDRWAADQGVVFSYVYISKTSRGPFDWSPMIATGESSADYHVVFDTPEVALLQRDAPVAARWPASGEDAVAPRDCQSLAEQNSDTISNFEATYGGAAATAWAAEHERLLPARPSLLTLATQVEGLLTRRSR